MRGPLDPEQLLSPGMLKSANTLLTVCLAALAAMGLLRALWSLLTWNPFTAIFQAGLAIAIPLSLWMIVRLLSESLAAQHNLNERITLLNETLWSDEDEELWEEMDVSLHEDANEDDSYSSAATEESDVKNETVESTSPTETAQTSNSDEKLTTTSDEAPNAPEENKTNQ
ncbi:hypothetical protein [Hirschia litorea]|uniref:Uncharacterized protein n=1 Tax=Hirschia litorea TaxID=1199156 RepID=A0ABW2INQ1_9PROT